MKDPTHDSSDNLTLSQRFGGGALGLGVGWVVGVGVEGILTGQGNPVGLGPVVAGVSGLLIGAFRDKIPTSPEGGEK